MYGLYRWFFVGERMVVVAFYSTVSRMNLYVLSPDLIFLVEIKQDQNKNEQLAYPSKTKRNCKSTKYIYKKKVRNWSLLWISDVHFVELVGLVEVVVVVVACFQAGVFFF